MVCPVSRKKRVLKKRLVKKSPDALVRKWWRMKVWRPNHCPDLPMLREFLSTSIIGHSEAKFLRTVRKRLNVVLRDYPIPEMGLSPGHMPRFAKLKT